MAKVDEELTKMNDQAIESSVNRELSRAKDKWQNEIHSAIQSNWIQTNDLPAEFRCQVDVRQAPSGLVLKVEFKGCEVGKISQYAVDSMVGAVYKASPLPRPPEPSLFDADLIITFDPTKR